MRLSRRWLLSFALFLTLLFVSTPVLAHANLVRSEPAANSAQKVAPKIVRLWFSEEVEPSFSSITVLDSSGTAVDKGDGHRMTDDSKGMEVSLNDLPQGLYTVVWKTTSAVDAHVVGGSFSFTVGDVPLAQASPRELMSEVDAALAASAPPPLYQVLVRWLNLLFLALLVGSFTFPLLILLPALRVSEDSKPLVESYITSVSEWFRGKASATAQGSDAPLESWAARWLRFTQVTFALFAVLTIATLFAQAFTVGNSYAAVGRVLTATRFGEVWLGRAVILIALGVVLFRARWRWTTNARTISPLLIATGLGLLLLLTQSLNSHGAAVSDPPLLPLVVDFIHLVGAVIWVGGLVQLLVTLPPLLRALPESRQMRAVASIIACFSLVAFVTVGIIVVSGAYSAIVEVGSLDAFFSTFYGTTLFVKFLLILPLLALGAFNLMVNRPDAAQAAAARLRALFLRLDLAVALEVILAAAVLLAVGVMTSAAPPVGAFRAPPTLWIETHRVSDINVTLGVAPALVGTNDFDVKIQDANGRAVSNAAVVRLIGTMREMDMGVQQVEATNQGNGHYTVHGDLMSMVGTWQLGVLVRRLGVDDVRTDFALVALGARLPPAPPLIASSPEAQGGLALTLFGFAFGTASVLMLKKRQARWAALGGAIGVSLIGAFVVYQVGANAPPLAYVVPVVPPSARLVRSPIAPVPSQIAIGQQIYSQNCATCHGTDGKGDGPAAANLTPKPADLTVHARQHTEGELFWWVTHGITTTAMPAWEGTLSDIQRWQVVQFIRTFGSNATPQAPIGGLPGNNPALALPDAQAPGAKSSGR